MTRTPTEAQAQPLQQLTTCCAISEVSCTAGAVRPEGLLPAHVRQEQHDETSGRWLGGFFSGSSAGSGAGGSSDNADIDGAFTADAFATNFGRRPAPKGGQLGGQLDGDTGIGGSLGTAFALDNE